MSVSVESLRAALACPSANQAVRMLHEQFLTLADRKYLQQAVLYPMLANILERLFENRTSACLLCCDLLSFELLQPPTPALSATSSTPAKAATSGGSLFTLLFRDATYPPTFSAHVATLLPPQLQRILRNVPIQHLPSFFSKRAMAPAAGAGAASKGVEYLEVSLQEYFFLSCTAFLLQPDVQVQAAGQPTTTTSASGMLSRSSATPSTSSSSSPPSPDSYNSRFHTLLERYFDFFLPPSGRHSSSLKLLDYGWNPSLIAHQGASLIEVLIEVWMGAFSYEAAQQASQEERGGRGQGQAQGQQMGGGGGGGVSPFGSSFVPPHAYSTPYLPPDGSTLPSGKVILAIQRIVYHMIEQKWMESPNTPAAIQAVTATRASILAYQQERYALHSSSLLSKLRVDVHLFGVLQHCFQRWDSEWSTLVGVKPVLVMAAAPHAPNAASTASSSFYASSLPPKPLDRLTKLVELWMDYLEPWKSIYGESFNPLLWRWWIVVNLPFYTILLRDFLRLLMRLHLGREQSSGRTAHLKTVLHLFRIIEGEVLKQVEEVEMLVFKHTPTTPQFTTTTMRGDATSSHSQQEALMARNALSHVAGVRPENYVPVFAPSATFVMGKPTSPTAAAGVATSAGSSFAFGSPSHHRVPSSSAHLHQRTPSAAVQPSSAPADAPPRLLESQQLALQLLRMYSIGYQSADSLTTQREMDLLNMPSESPSAMSSSLGQPRAPVGLSLLAQEEQLGQFIEKRLRTIFQLPHTPPPADGSRSRLMARNNMPESTGPDSVPAPKSLRELEPERAPNDPFLRLTAAGRQQIRLGNRICSKYDVPILPDENIICSYEIEPLVHWSRRASEALNRRWGLPKHKGGFKINLRFLAHQQVVKAMLFLFCLLVFTVWMRFR